MAGYVNVVYNIDNPEVVKGFNIPVIEPDIYFEVRPSKLTKGFIPELYKIVMVNGNPTLELKNESEFNTIIKEKNLSGLRRKCIVDVHNIKNKYEDSGLGFRGQRKINMYLANAIYLIRKEALGTATAEEIATINYLSSIMEYAYMVNMVAEQELAWINSPDRTLTELRQYKAKDADWPTIP